MHRSESYSFPQAVHLRGRWRTVLLPLICTAFLGPTALLPALASEWDRVERVVDGDTVILESRGRARLIGVDSPESVHPARPVERYAREAADFTRSRIEGKPVRVEVGPEPKDDHGRWLVYLFTEDGESFNEKLVEQGYAYAYTLYPFAHRFRYLALEDRARSERRGLWREATLGPYHGNDRSRVYHAPSCAHYECSRCVLVFEGREEAERQGFRPHWGCVGSQ